MTRVGYWIALVAIVIGAPLLIVDLTRPERFWHMVWKSDTGGPMFKYYSAISIGIWIILAFVIFVAFWPLIAALADTGRIRKRSSRCYRIEGILRQNYCSGLHPHWVGAGRLHRSGPDRHQPSALGRHHLDHPPLSPLRHLRRGARR